MLVSVIKHFTSVSECCWMFVSVSVLVLLSAYLKRFSVLPSTGFLRSTKKFIYKILYPCWKYYNFANDPMDISQIQSQNTDEHNMSRLSKHNLVYRCWCFDCSWLVGILGTFKTSYWKNSFSLFVESTVGNLLNTFQDIFFLHCTMKAHKVKHI